MDNGQVIKEWQTKRNPYIPFYIFWDKNVSWKAKGVYAYIASTPPDWRLSIEGISVYSSDKTYAVQSAVKELEDKGYLVRSKVQDSQGRFTGWSYTLMSKPTDTGKNPLSEKSIVGKTDPTNQYPYSYQNTSTENNNVTNKETINNPPNIPPNGKAEPKVTFTESDPVNDMFKQFWNAYPKSKRKADKARCLTAFRSIQNLSEEFPRIMQGLELWKKDKDWTKDSGQFIPAPLVWIHQRKWEGIIEAQGSKYDKSMEKLERLKKEGFI